MADHTRHAHAGVRRIGGVVVAALLPRRVAHDRLAGDRVPRHALRVQGMCAGDRHDGVDLVGEHDRPLERLHPTERAAGHRGEPLDPQRIQERALGPDHVRDGDHREVRAVRAPRRGVERGRSRRPAAAAEQVRGDDEVAVRVERLARTDHPVPPAEPLSRLAVAVLRAEPIAGARGRRRLLGEAGGMGVAAERVADQDRVVAPGREHAVGLVGNANRMQLASAVERHGIREVEVARLDGSDRAGVRRRYHRHFSISGVISVYSLGFQSRNQPTTQKRGVKGDVHRDRQWSQRAGAA